MEQNQIQEDVQFIRQMIENNRRSLVDNGLLYLGIGIFVILGSLISWLLVSVGYESYLPVFWLCAMAVFIVVIFVILKRAGQRQPVKNFAGTVSAAVWQACGVPLLLITVLFFVTGKVALHEFFSVMASVLGIGYFLTGVINELKLMKFLAVGWWAAAVLAVMWSYIGPEYQLGLIFTVFVAVFELLPGIVIFRKWKKIYNEQTV